MSDSYGLWASCFRKGCCTACAASGVCLWVGISPPERSFVFPGLRPMLRCAGQACSAYSGECGVGAGCHGSQGRCLEMQLAEIPRVSASPFFISLLVLTLYIHFTLTLETHQTHLGVRAGIISCTLEACAVLDLHTADKEAGQI